jgi:type I restriction enzyme S subunit
MIADLKPYPKYKESGLPWLGPVPVHWETRPAFGAFVPNHERNFGMKEKTVLSLSYGKIVIKPLEKLHGLVPESFETYQIVNPGDIVIRTTDLQNDHTSLRVGMVRNRGIITSAYLALQVNAGIIPDFGFQFLNVWDTSKAIYGYGSGLRQNLDFSDFKRMPVALPPPDEQAAIVRFLDWANGRLEKAIRAKRKVIALLTEQKQAIIHRAVTRGLDPNVPLKSSGIPWLGDIPKHWEVKRLKAIAQIRYGLGQPPRESETGLPLIRATNVDQGKILEKNLVRVDPADVPKTRNAFLKVGEIIVVRSGALTADSAIIPEEYEGAVAGYDMVVTVRSARAEFIAMVLLSSYVQADQLVIASMRAAQPHLNAEELGTAILLLPPDEEQKQIVQFVRNESSPIDTAIARLEREIGLLREYRTRLVADVVTGKLDVRQAAAQLPDETLPVTGDASGEAEPDEEEATA